MDDRAQILEMIARYSYAWDGQDAEGWAALFTEDAVWESLWPGSDEPRSRIAGHEQLLRGAMVSFGGRLQWVQTRHHQSSTIFDELSAGRARTRTMILVTHLGPEDKTPRSVVSGVYHDEWVKTTQGWRFARRSLHADGR